MNYAKKRVLLAEDYEDTLYMLQKLICGETADCDAVTDGGQAVEAYDRAVAEGRPYDLITLDAAMPKLTGYQVAEYVRKEKNDPVPIIIVTAHTEPLAKAHADYSGATDFWPKPIDPQDFKRRVRQILEGGERSTWSQSGLRSVKA